MGAYVASISMPLIREAPAFVVMYSKVSEFRKST